MTNPLFGIYSSGRKWADPMSFRSEQATITLAFHHCWEQQTTSTPESRSIDRSVEYDLEPLVCIDCLLIIDWSNFKLKTVTGVRYGQRHHHHHNKIILWYTQKSKKCRIWWSEFEFKLDAQVFCMSFTPAMAANFISRIHSQMCCFMWIFDLHAK